MGSLICGFAVAEEKTPAVETRIGVADIEQILDNYWRTPSVKHEVERYRTSEEFQEKQREIAKLDRELADQRFRFFKRQQTTRKIQDSREELRALAAKDAERAHEREKEAVEGLLTDVRRAAESIGRDQALTVIFDSNAPHIIFLNTDASGMNDVTDVVTEKLNSR